MSTPIETQSAEAVCNHYNDRLDPEGTVRLRPLRCLRDLGHDGVHVCGSTSWGEQLGFRANTPANQDPESGERGGA